MESQSETTQTVSTLKLPEVIVNGDSVSPVASASTGAKGIKENPEDHSQQNYENFAASSQEGLDKTYDRFQKLISQLEIHGEVISQEDANLKLLRSLPSAWNNIALIMRNKSNLDTLSMDDFYNNLKVYESKIKGKSSSRLNSQNVAFVSSDNSSSTNETINTAHSVSAASFKDQASTASYVDDVMFSFFSNQSNASQLDYEDLEQIDADDLEEIDLKWQVAMLTMRVKRFIKKMRRKMDLNDKETVGFDRTKVECYNCHRRVDISTTNALVVQDRIGGYDWSFQAEEGITNFALMAYTYQGSSSSSSSDSEVHTCSKDCSKSYETLQKQYDQQREALKKSNLEIIVKDISIKDLKNQLEEALKKKDDLKLKLEKFEESSKNLTKLIDSQKSAKDKTGLGYDSQMNESEVVHSVFNSRESDVDDSPVNDRFKIDEGFHAVPPPYTRNYMPLRPDLSFAGLDDSVYKTKVLPTWVMMNPSSMFSGVESTCPTTAIDCFDELTRKIWRFSKQVVTVWDLKKYNSIKLILFAHALCCSKIINAACFDRSWLILFEKVSTVRTRKQFQLLVLSEKNVYTA
ncbi:hypothetical protein Tco_0241287 [Tanacetum coccineum]